MVNSSNKVVMITWSYSRLLHIKSSEHSPLTSPGPPALKAQNPRPWSRMLCWSQVSIRFGEQKSFDFPLLGQLVSHIVQWNFSATLARREQRQGEKDTLVRVEMFTYYEGLFNKTLYDLTAATLSFLDVILSLNLGTSRSVWPALFCVFARASSCLYLVWNSGGVFLRVLLCFIHQPRLLWITPDIFSSRCGRVPLFFLFCLCRLMSSACPTLSLNNAGAAPDWFRRAWCDIDRAVDRNAHSSVRSCLPEELPFDYCWFFNDTVSSKWIFHGTSVTHLYCWIRRHVEFLPP